MVHGPDIGGKLTAGARRFRDALAASSYLLTPNEVKDGATKWHTDEREVATRGIGVATAPTGRRVITTSAQRGRPTTSVISAWARNGTATAGLNLPELSSRNRFDPVPRAP